MASIPKPNILQPFTPSFLIPKSLSDLGFYSPDPTPIPRLVVSTTGHEKSGKNHWAFTAPGPIAAISFDTGTKTLVKKFVREYGKQIVMREIEPPSEVDGQMKEAKAQWAMFETMCQYFLTEKWVRTLVIDTATEAWQLLRMSEFGKLTQVLPQHYVKANMIFRTLVKDLYGRENLNVIWLHKMKKQYKGKASGGDKESWTGKYERDGFGDMDFLADVNLTHYWEEARAVDEAGVPDDRGVFKQKVFGVKVGECREDMVGVAGESLESKFGHMADSTWNVCDFPSLAQMVFPQAKFPMSTAAYWQAG